MKIFGFLLAVLVLFCLGFTWRDVQNGQVPDTKPFAKMFGLKTETHISAEAEFKQAYNRILTSYYRKVKPLELKYAGMSGMMAALGDPHTMFLTPRIAKSFNIDTKANYVGVGARLSPDPLGAKVTQVFEDAPAFEAGLRRGDLIVGVNGKSVAGAKIDDIVEKIQGEEGTRVQISVLKSGKGKPVVLRSRRAHVVTPTVESAYFKDSKVGYILIASVSAPTAEQFDKELDKIERNEMKGLVIDVRGNPGGYLETATELLSRFRGDKVVVKMKLRDGKESYEYTPSGLEHKFTYPIVVLMNEDSASAAEIFAGCLHDYGVATLVGTHSYGKASVQEVFDFRDGSSGKITIARYYLPSTHDIGRKVDADGVYISGGLQPDVKVDFAETLPQELQKNAKPPASDLPDPSFDNQLAKAIQVVLTKAGAKRVSTKSPIPQAVAASSVSRIA